MSTRPIQLIIAYDGTDFGGWQRQKNARSVQEELEKALATMHKHPVSVTGAGRTDAGVHARGQVAGFFTDIETIPAQKFALALNKLLPRDIRVMKAFDAPEDFHARFDASRRIYRYFFSTDRLADPFSIRYAWQLHRVPRLNVLNAMAQIIIGEQDFSAFAAAQDPSPSKFRFVESSVFWAEADKIVYQISANAFLWRMVRSLVGTMMFLEHDAADPKAASLAMKRILDSKDRKLAGPTAPPYGLFLWSVEYGERDYGHARR